MSLALLAGRSGLAGGQAPPASAPLPAGVSVPTPLQPWTGWVLHGAEEALCPPLDGVAVEAESSGECAWPARLQLTVDEHGGRFTQQWRVRGKRSAVALPGDARRWPQTVRVDGAPAIVVPDDARPAVLLRPGDHTVTGAFLWDEPPESLPVPPETGLLALTVRGKKIDQPNRDADGQLWLEKAASEAEADVLEIAVHRLLEDDIPLQLTTQIQLRAAGKSREVVLGRALPDGFAPMSLTSALPARLEADGRLRVQVRPGTFTITLAARHDGPLSSLARPAPDGPWKEGDEVWVFAARPDLRVVLVEGVAAIDPQQTTLPEAWKRLPTYAVKLGDTLKLLEQRRGDAVPAPDALSLRRDLWLDFDGGGWTVRDALSGTLHRSWRLEVSAPQVLGRVAVGGVDQFITLGEQGRPGVEIRQGTIQASADSRLPGGGGMSAVGWDADFHDVKGTLHLPPGFRLFHVAGADEVPGTWLRSWSLLDLFLALIIAMAISQLYGWRFGALSLLTLALTFPERGAPRWIWLLLLALEALVRVVPAGRFATLVRVARLGARVALLLLAVAFSVTQVRHGIYPQLASPQGGGSGSSDSDGRFDEGGDLTLSLNAKEAPPPPPEQQQQQQQAAADALDEDSEAKPAPSGGAKAGADSSPRDVYRKFGGKQQKSPRSVRQYVQEYDPNQIVQTGPGLPRWSWSALPLSWSGPVERTQRLRLVILPPWVNLLLALLRVALLALLALRLVDSGDRDGGLLRLPSLPSLPGRLFLLALGLPALTPTAARADLPTKELLDELKARLLKPAECRPHCVASARLALDAQPTLLRLRLEVDAAAPSGVPLPGRADQWSPERVLLDGKPAPALLQRDGKLWLDLPEGSHEVILEGALPERDIVQIALPLKSHRVEAHTEGWQLAGLHEDGLADDDLQLTRVRAPAGAAAKPGKGSAALQPGALPPFVRVERLLTLGLVWQVETKVTRLTPLGSAVVIEVPLLPGESVTTAEVRVVQGKAQVNLGATASEVSWRSLLKEAPELQLQAPRGLPWVEVWQLEAGPVWHVALRGIPVVHQLDPSGLRRPEWRPWPGESVTIAVSRPRGVPGQTLTIDKSCLIVRPGLRATDATLTLDVRASRGGRHELTLPPGAVVQSLTIDGQAQPIREDQGRLLLPILPGRQRFEICWRQPDAIGIGFRAPQIDLGAPSVNAEIAVEPAADRWVLFAGGPRLGPAVLFWSLLLILAIVAVGLGRIRWTPLRFHHWLLLALGLTQVPLVAAAVVAGWLIALGWRAEQPGVEWPGQARFNLRQVLLVLCTAAALVILVVSIHEGLLGEPEMQIAGNGSDAAHLRWYHDRVTATLPRPWVVSVPIMAYRIAMLLWALWLARALLSWLRWGFRSFGSGGYWRRRPAPPLPPSAPPPADNSVKAEAE